MLPSEDELKERYSSYPNNKLLSIVHNKNDYTPQAFEIAKAELASRNLTTAEVDVFLDEKEQEQLAAKVSAMVPLKLWEKMLFFFFWFAGWLLGGALRMNFREDGLLLKVKQSKVFTIAGFVSLLLDGFCSVYFNLSNEAGLALLLVLFLLFLWLEKKFSYEVIAE